MRGEAFNDDAILSSIEALYRMEAAGHKLDWVKEYGGVKRKIRHDGGYWIEWRDSIGQDFKEVSDYRANQSLESESATILQLRPNTPPGDSV